MSQSGSSHAVTAAGVGKALPPHPAANVMDLYMSEYDYDFNRDTGADGATGNDNITEADAWISGDVRNRPPFAHNAGEFSGATTYRTYHDAKTRPVDIANLARDAQKGLIDGGSPFMREYYRPGLTANADGAPAPISMYRAEHNNKGAVPQGENTLYAGAKAASYDPEFLSRGVPDEVIGGDVPPNITDPASLLPRHPVRSGAGEPVAAGSRKGAPPVSGASATIPGLGEPGEYTCTSWCIGDTSNAYPSQLPQGLAGSANAHALDPTETDKAALLRKLAGLPAKAKAMPYRIDDDTNPVFLTVRDQQRCTVSKRLDREGHVKMSMYQSEHVNQYRLPELPGNHPEPHPGNTRTDPSATSGERVDGTLTRDSRRDGNLRNSHGYLKPEVPASLQGTVGQSMLDTLRVEERVTAVDRADPHRRKLK